MSTPSEGRSLAPLRGGRHGLSREQVAQSQRERLLAAVVQVVAEKGYQATTITEIAKTASVSSRDFYENFKSKEDCFLAAIEVVFEHMHELLIRAAEPEPDWPREAVAGLRAALDFFISEPEITQVCLIGSITSAPAILVRRSEIMHELIPFLERGRGERTEAEPLPESTEESLIGGLLVLVTRSIGTGRSLETVYPDLVEFLLSPYLGAERGAEMAAAARKEGVHKKT